MANATLAASTQSSPLVLERERDYESILATLTTSARGRWFLDEFARRNRSADTRPVLAAIERLPSPFRDDSSRAYQRLRGELTATAKALAQHRSGAEGWRSRSAHSQELAAAAASTSARPNACAAAGRIQDAISVMRERRIDPVLCEQLTSVTASIISIASRFHPDDQRVSALGDLLHHLERRIEAMLVASARAVTAAGVALPGVVNDKFGSHANGENLRPVGGVADADCGPALAGGMEPTATAGSASQSPEAIVDGEALHSPRPPLASRTGESNTTGSVAVTASVTEAIPQSRARDPLAPLRAMSEAERIALFS